MKSVAIVVEGQTEEVFLNDVVQGSLGDGVWLQPIIVRKGQSASGRPHKGGGGWKHYAQMLTTLSGQPQWDLITTLVDYYGLPGDAPACSCTPSHVSAHDCADARQAGIADAIGDPRLRPFIAVHEFEAIVIAAAAASPHVLGSEKAAREFQFLLRQHNGNAETINDGVNTAPSKRVAAVIDGYAKTRDTVPIIREAGLDAALAHCPRFAGWISELQELGRSGI